MLCDGKDVPALSPDTAQAVPGSKADSGAGAGHNTARLATRCRKPALVALAATAVFMASNLMGEHPGQPRDVQSLYDMQPVDISVSEIQSKATVAELD